MNIKSRGVSATATLVPTMPGRRTVTSMLLAAAVSLSFVFTFFLVAPSPASAADTNVFCAQPQLVVIGGRGGGQPRLQLNCTGGSNVGFADFSFLIASNPTLTLVFEHAVASWVLEHGTNSTIVISSPLSDTSGNAWGCGAANCRILDAVVGY